MPVAATPVDDAKCASQSPTYPGGPTPAILAVSCNNRNVFSTQTSSEAVTGTPILARIKSVRLPAAQPATLQHIMHTEQGAPINLQDCVCLTDGSGSSMSIPPYGTDEFSISSSSEMLCGFGVRFTMQETLEFYCAHPIIDMPATVVDADAGLVQVKLTADQLKHPGVYFGQFSLVQYASNENESDVVVLSNLFYIIIGRNLSRIDGFCSLNGPPTVPEIRLFLRDTSSIESFLLDGLKFSDEEIAYAIQLPVMYWNENPPPVDNNYTTLNFPYRYHWLIAITGYLFMIASEQFRANNLKYSAGGTQVDDMDKEAPYEAAADRRLAEWRSFVLRKKVSINHNLGWGNLGSGYPGSGNWGW